jgi:hypothetical protein
MEEGGHFVRQPRKTSSSIAWLRLSGGLPMGDERFEDLDK